MCYTYISIYSTPINYNYNGLDQILRATVDQVLYLCKTLVLRKEFTKKRAQHFANFFYVVRMTRTI